MGSLLSNTILSPWVTFTLASNFKYHLYAKNSQNSSPDPICDILNSISTAYSEISKLHQIQHLQKPTHDYSSNNQMRYSLSYLFSCTSQKHLGPLFYSEFVSIPPVLQVYSPRIFKVLRPLQGISFKSKLFPIIRHSLSFLSHSLKSV